MKIYTVVTDNYEMESKAFSKRELAEEYADWLPYYWDPTIHEIEVENELHLDKQYHVFLEIKCFYNGEKAISSKYFYRLPNITDGYEEGYCFSDVGELRPGWRSTGAVGEDQDAAGQGGADVWR